MLVYCSVFLFLQLCLSLNRMDDEERSSGGVKNVMKYNKLENLRIKFLKRKKKKNGGLDQVLTVIGRWRKIWQASKRENITYFSAKMYILCVCAGGGGREIIYHDTHLAMNFVFRMLFSESFWPLCCFQELIHIPFLFHDSPFFKTEEGSYGKKKLNRFSVYSKTMNIQICF